MLLLFVNRDGPKHLRQMGKLLLSVNQTVSHSQKLSEEKVKILQKNGIRPRLHQIYVSDRDIDKDLPVKYYHYVYVCMHVCKHVCVYVHVYVCMCMYVCTVFLPEFRYLLLFSTLRAKVKCNLQFSARSFNLFVCLYFQLENFGTHQTREVDI